MEAKSFVQRMKALTTTALKQADTFMPAFGSWLVTPSRTDYNYKADIGDGLSSSVVMPVVQWLQRSFPEAPLVVRRQQGDELEIVAAHPLVELVNRPNAYYPGTLLWMVTLSDWCLFGESYWRILYTNGGAPGELWYIPPWAIEPQWPRDGSAFISHYAYRPEIGTQIDLSLEEVLHFRHGLDPRNPRHGLPPLRALIREIWADAEVSNWIASILRNMGIPGMIISPKGDSTLSPDDVEQVKAYISSRFTGDHRGEPMALGGPTDVHRLSFTPSEIDPTVWRNAAEERVSAALGVSSAVIGFHSGLENSKVGATMAEFVRLSWNNGLVPLQRLMAAELQRVLLPQFEVSPEGYQVGWNYDEVEALQADQNELAKRYEGLVTAGILKVSEARQALGYESDPEDEIYLRPSSLTPTDPKDQMPEPEPVPLALPAANGNGQNGNGVAANGNRNGQPEQRALALKQGSLEEWVTDQIGRHADRMDIPPRKYLRLAARQQRAAERVQQRFEGQIRDVLKRYGEVAATAATEILRPAKQSLEDIVKMTVIRERLPMIGLQVELAAIYEELYDAMASAFLTLMRDAQDLEPTDPSRIRAALRTVAQDRPRLLDLEGDARDGILRSLEDAREQGLDEDAMIDLIRNRVPSGRWSSPDIRAQMIVRTESRMAGNLVSSETARQMGGRVLILDALLGPTDAECLPAGTEVVALDPERSFRRWFEGDLIDIRTADGHFLSATGNHPILTSHGWVVANQLKVGDEVICCLDPQRLAMYASGECRPDDNDMPSSGEQGFNLTDVSCPASTISQTFGTGNLNRQWRDSEVNVVPTKCALRDSDQPSIFEPRPQTLFVGAIELARSFTTERALCQSCIESDNATISRMGRTNSLHPLLSGHVCIHEDMRFRNGPELVASFSQAIGDMGTTDVQLFGDLSESDAGAVKRPGQLQVNCFSKASPPDTVSFENTQDRILADIEGGSQLQRALSGYVTCDKVISIHIRPFKGHVHNLQTRQGWYVANSIITHNCEARNGWIVNPSEARMLAGVEHVNGTLTAIVLNPSVVTA